MKFKTKPLPHQQDEWEMSRSKPCWAIFWEQGTGKTKLTLDTVAWQAHMGFVDGLLVIAPNGVHENWITDEIPLHFPIDAATHTYHSSRAGTKTAQRELKRVLESEQFAVLAMTYEGFMTKRGRKAADDFVKKRKPFVVLDEASRIKNPNAKRTRSLCAFGKKVERKRILTGTPAFSPLNLYSQFKFLDDGFWKEHGFASFAPYKTHFMIWQQIEKDNRRFEVPVGPRNLDQLAGIVDRYSSRVTKDVLDLPPKLYSKRRFELSPEQKRLYREIRDNFMTFLDGEMVTTPLIIQRLLRLQQIACGHLTDDFGKVTRISPNPRISLLLEDLEDIDHSVIVWARFREDIDQICEALGDRAVRYDGSTTVEDRKSAKDRFQAGDVPVFVANPAAAATGLTLHRAKTVIYYSNSFDPELRAQSEDRAHRHGQDGAIIEGLGLGVHYLDYIGIGTVDNHIVSTLRERFDIARKLTGDQVREWL